jgi:hypothetical protein
MLHNLSRLLLTVAVLVLAACGAKTSERLVGKWVVDLDKMSQLDDVKKLPPEQAKAAMEMVKGLTGAMSFEFTKDKLTIEVLGHKKEGVWAAKSESTNKVTLDATLDGNTQTLDAEFVGDTLVLSKGGQKFALKKK